MRTAVDDVNGLLRGRLTVGMVTACEVTPLFDALAAFHRAHPGVELSLLEDNSDRLVERIRTGAADLALIGWAGDPPGDLGALPIISEGLVAAVPDGHPLLDAQRVTVAELADHPLVCLPEGTGVRTVLDRACAAAGVKPDIALQAAAPGAVLDLARRGLGAAILSGSMAADVDGLCPVVVHDLPDPAVLALVWAGRERMDPAVQALLDHARRSFGHR